MTANEVLAHRDAFVLVDVREPRELAVSTIPGALTRDEFEARKAELKAKGATIVPYCTIGYRSGLYTEELREQGFEAKNLEGSLLSWTWAGGPLVHDDEPTKRVHVYGPQWNLVAEGYEGVWGASADR